MASLDTEQALAKLMSFIFWASSFSELSDPNHHIKAGTGNRPCIGFMLGDAAGLCGELGGLRAAGAALDHGGLAHTGKLQVDGLVLW